MASQKSQNWASGPGSVTSSQVYRLPQGLWTLLLNKDGGYSDLQRLLIRFLERHKVALGLEHSLYLLVCHARGPGCQDMGVTLH